MRLSKSRLVAYKQCPKRLWLQTFRRELAQQSEASANRIAQGNLVGTAAQRLYPEGRLIAHVADLGAAVRETTEALAEPGDITLFEPALRCADVMVRADVLIRRDNRYRMIEVKSSTRVRDSHLADTAIQTWVARGAGLDIERVELAHIDNTFVYAGDGNYRGLFAHADMTDAVLPLQEQIPVWIAAAQNDLAGPMPDIATGPQCRKPFECEFLAFCQPETAEYPVELLPNSTRLARQLRGDGFADLRDVPLDRLKREDHRRIWRATVAGRPCLDAAAAAKLAALPWPRYFLDFETVGPAVPMWQGTRPYQKAPMQWSCHRQDVDGTLTQLPPFLDTTGHDPRRAFAERLVAAIGDTGTIMVYNAAFERGVMMQLAEMFDDLAPALRSMASRLYDLLILAREHYYHPSMMGSWSIKRVLPTIAPDLDYGNLESVQSGDMVEPAYFEMVSSATSAERKLELEAALLTYCARDTLGMVRVAGFMASEGVAAGHLNWHALAAGGAIADNEQITRQSRGNRTAMNVEDTLKATIAELVRPGKGILAADESGPTITKRFAALGIESTEETRRRYRTLLFTAAGVAEYLGGIILFEETLGQRDNDGTLLPDVLSRQGILVGIKVDKGTTPLPNAPGDLVTQGLDGLADRLKTYKAQGARFAKWREVYGITDRNPTGLGIMANAQVLARYAAICQQEGIVPIVEPEVLIDGEHSIERCHEVSESVLHAVFDALHEHGVILEGMVLKPSMVLSGNKSGIASNAEQVAKATLEVLRRTVPAAVPAINFLSGGQSPESATANLNAMNTMYPHAPWVLSFSYARALQDPAMRAWAGLDANVPPAQKAFSWRLRMNSLARAGKWKPELERAT